ncbi:tape measure protein [Parabacteroides distasonis]|uniref:tape measure protein n=1 Tax=Parabacteroides distasonis TaxID=823 RepID=UPI0035646086
MPKLAFHIEADYQKVIKLREEIDKLKSTISGMDGNTSPATFRAMEAQLAKNTKELDSLVASAVRAGNEINQGFKKKIFDASQVVNGFSEKIIAQKAVIKDVETDVKRLGEAYRIALKRNPLSANEKLEEYNAARKALDGEKAALFGLTQEQANALLSVKKLRDEYTLYRQEGIENVDVTKQIEQAMSNVGKKLLGGYSIKEFLSNMVRVRGEFQAADTAIQTLLGSKEKADELMSQVREYAKISPLEFSDVTQATQMMLGFNIEVEKVPRYLQAIGDVSMGDTQRFNSLTLAFSQMSAAGKLMGQDLNQMINAGFNPLQIMADKTGKSIATLKDEMSKGAISAEMVQQAFIDATSAGGKFYNMSENASKTINGQLSMMQDAMDSVFNELGQKSEGVIIKGIQTTTSLIENYETIGKVLVGLAATYGVYRTALIASITLTRSWAVAARVDAAAKGIQTIATKAQTVAQLALNAAMKANPYVSLATIVASFAATMWVLHDSTTAAEKAQKQLNKEQVEAARRKQELISKTDSLISKINSETESVYSQVKAYKELIKLFPELGNMSFEEFKNMPQDQQKKMFSSINKKREMDDAVKAYEADLKRIEELKKKIQETEESPYNKSDNSWIHDVERLNKQLETANNLAKLHKEEIEKIKEAQWEANTPVEEKVKHYEDVKKRLIEEKDELEKTLTKSEDIASVWMGVPDIISSIRLDALNKQIDETTGKINSLTRNSISVVQNKSYWEKQKQDAEVARNALDVSKKNSEDWNKYTKQIQEAQTQIDKYSDSTKREKQEKKEVDKQLKQQKTIHNELLSLRRQNQQSEIDLMKEGSAKKIAQINLDYDNEIAAILTKEKEWKDAQGGKLTKEQTVEIRTALVNSYVKRERSTSNVNKEQLEEEKRAMNEYLKEYGSYLDKRDAITALYNEKIAKATTEGERKSLSEAMKRELSDLDIEASKTTSAISRLFGDMKDKTLSELEAINRKGREALEFLKSGVWDESKGKDFGITKETFELWSKSPDKLKDISDALKENKEAADKLRPAYEKVAKGLKGVFEAGNDTKKLRQAIDDIEEGLGEIMRSGQFLSDTFSKLGDSFGGAFGEIAEGLNVAMDAVNSAMDGAKAGAMFGPIGASAGAAIGVVTSLASSIAKIHDKKNESRIQRLQDQIDTLDKSYDKLGRSIEKAYSKDASKLIDQQNKLLEQQKVLIQNQIKEEEDKKKTDNDRIKEWRDQIDEINNTIADNKEAGKDAIFGSDIKSAIDDFANAYADAWAAGEDKAQSAKDLVRKMIRNMVTESIKAAASDPMKAIREKLLEFWSDDYISDWEQDYLDRKAQELADDLDRKFGWADKYFNTGNAVEEDDGRTASSKGVGSISQDSADVIDGKMSTQLIFLDRTLVQVTGIADQMRFIYDLQTRGWKNVEAIKDLSGKVSENTAKVAEISGRIEALSEKIEANTKSAASGIKTINDKGILMRSR